MIVLEVVEPPLSEQACRICGARRRPDEPDTAWTADRHVQYARRELRRVRLEDGSEVDQARERPWHRRHVSCVPEAPDVLAALTGTWLPEGEAREVLRQHGRSVTAGDRQSVNRKKWEHIGKAERSNLAALVAPFLAPPAQVAHPSGRCGVCGRSRSTRWTPAGGVTWPDRTAAYACDRCEDMMPSGAQPSLVKVRALGRVAGARPSPSLRGHNFFAFKVACEVLKPDERHADGFASWEYRPAALQRIRAAVAASLPELLLDPEARARGVELLQSRRVRAAAEEARRQAAEHPGADVEW